MRRPVHLKLLETQVAMALESIGVSQTAAHTCALLLLGRYQKADYWVRKGTIIDWGNLPEVIKTRYPSPDWFDYEHCTIEQVEHYLWKYSCIPILKLKSINKHGLRDVDTHSVHMAFDLPWTTTSKGKTVIRACIRVWTSEDDACDLIYWHTPRHAFLAYRDQYTYEIAHGEYSTKPINPMDMLYAVMDDRAQHTNEYKWRRII